jgi:hypothetical protein
VLCPWCQVFNRKFLSKFKELHYDWAEIADGSFDLGDDNVLYTTGNLISLDVTAEQGVLLFGSFLFTKSTAQLLISKLSEVRNKLVESEVLKFLKDFLFGLPRPRPIDLKGKMNVTLWPFEA